MESRPFRTTRRLQNLTSTRPGWYRVENKTAGPAQITIYDEIGMLGVSADNFLREVSEIKGDVELHVNSPGGDIFDGIAIYNSLRQRQGDVSVVIDGLAASAASFISQAASPGKLKMAPHSQMMLHNGFGMVIGDANDLRKTADLLDKATQNIASIYAERSGKSVEYWRGVMNEETWYDDHEAVAEGLADGILGQDPPRNAWDLSVFRNAVSDDDDDDADDNGGWVQRDGKWVFDPDDDGDDDYQASTDSDHGWWDENGKQLKPIPASPDGKYPAKPMPGKNKGKKQYWNRDYSADERKSMAKKGHAMPDGSYPIADAEDLDNAIHAVGRGNADHDAIRRHIIKRAAALGLSSRIPDNWNNDGSLKEPANQFDPSIICRALKGAI